ncbi:S1C family serine protease [Cyanobium sp. ATX 6F1]|uniref:S1C family serine protease n=1 Tax=Cyanobium sp. ATX 6F1 TaxID=2823702 RepID=UPI0020CBF25E|nr:S1C family serine protease [Cyanobium sp. ATX 6F1]MCP9915879.1 serine protease [Cyanobium sp. ATX 6F1]
MPPSPKASRPRWRASLALSGVALALGGCAMVQATALAPRLQPPLAVGAGGRCTNGNRNAEQIFSASKNGVAVVRTDRGLGSAFVVAQQNGTTYLVTNAHVVEGSDGVNLKWVDGRSDGAQVVARGGGGSPTNDLALLAVQGTRGQVLKLNDRPSAVGQEVFVIGAPKGLEFSLSRGVVSSLRDRDGILQIDAAINPGNSGGPVLDARNCVAGIATFKYNDSEGLNFAVSAAAVRDFLKRLPAAGEGSAGGSDDTARVPYPEARPSEPEGVAPGAPSVCVFRRGDQADAERIPCRLSRLQNDNGQTIYDLAWADGSRNAYAFFESGKVLIQASDGQGGSGSDEGRFQVGAAGVAIQSSPGNLAFIPGLNPVLN